MKILKRVGIVALILVTLLATVFFVYVGNYYKATSDVIEALKTEEVTITEEKNITIFSPKQDDEKIGIVFYPGGKVEAKAYSILLIELVKKGYTAALVKMPFNLAVFNANGANKAISKIPDIDTWYMSGHSLGGAMANKYASDNTDKIKGLILLGAYLLYDINSMPSITIYGSNDKVLSKEKIDRSKDYFEIEGGNHANFANYGKQKGDGEATISREEQQAQTVDRIVTFINQTDNV